MSTPLSLWLAQHADDVAARWRAGVADEVTWSSLLADRGEAFVRWVAAELDPTRDAPPVIPPELLGPGASAALVRTLSRLGPAIAEGMRARGREPSGPETGRLLQTLSEVTAQAGLVASRARNQRIVDNVQVSIWEIDYSQVIRAVRELSDGGVEPGAHLRAHPEALVELRSLVAVTSVNPYTLELFGTESLEQLDANLRRVFPGGSTHRLFVDLIEAMLAGQRGYASEVRIINLERGELTVLLAATFAEDDPEFRNVLLTMTDITARKELEATQRELAAIVDGSEDAILSKDLSGQIRSWNAGAEAMLGYAASEIVGRPIGAIVPPELLPEEDALLEQVRAGQRLKHFETTRLAKDGARVEVSLTLSPVRGPDGEIVGVSSVARDVSDRRRAERAADAARRALAEANASLEERVEERTADLSLFTYQVSHDLRAPLRVIQGFAEAVLEDYGERLDETGRFYLQRIEAGALRLDRLIHDLLTYSRLGRERANLTAIALPPLIDAVLEGLQPTIEEVGAEIVREEAVDAHVLGHAPTLALALENLIGNALKFMPPERTPRIVIETDEQAGRVRLTVADNGVGIPLRQQETVWRVFERLHADEEFPGTGIGLALVQRAIQKMQGTCGMSSVPDVGSRFWIELAAPALAEAPRLG